MPEMSRARSSPLSRRRALLMPTLAPIAFPAGAKALALPKPDPWALSPDVRDIKIRASVLVRSDGRWKELRTGHWSPRTGEPPPLESGGLLRPELGNGLDKRAAEVAAATLDRYSTARREQFERGGWGFSEPAPLPGVIFPEHRVTYTEADEQTRLYIFVTLFVQDLSDDLPDRPQPGVRFLAIMDSASQRRGPRRDNKQRALRSRVTHHTVTSSTIEEQLLKRFNGVVERAVHFGGWEPLR